MHMKLPRVCQLSRSRSPKSTNLVQGHHTYEIEHDPTYFSMISQRYQEVVLFLLTCSLDDLPEVVDPETLDTFRKVYGESEFTCRFHECPYHSDGFHSIEARNAHEHTHMKTLRCADPSCEFFARGFISKTGLQKHNRRYHPGPEEVELPKFEPARAISPPPVESPPRPQRQATPPPPSPSPAPPPLPPPPPIQHKPEGREPVKKVRQRRGKRGLRVHDCRLCTKVLRFSPLHEE
jgi:hypothetical protein